MSDDLTPTEDLLMELLAARQRLGEPWWTFDSRHRRALERLERRGFVEVMSPQVEHTVRAQFTEEGRDRFLWSEWKPAHQVAVEHIADEIDDVSALGWWFAWADARRIFTREAAIEMADDASRVLQKYGRLLGPDGQRMADEHLARLTRT